MKIIACGISILPQDGRGNRKKRQKGGYAVAGCCELRETGLRGSQADDIKFIRNRRMRCLRGRQEDWQFLRK